MKTKVNLFKSDPVAMDRLQDFVWGAGTVVDPFPQDDKGSYKVWGSDRQALAADWKAVGDDIYWGVRGGGKVGVECKRLNYEVSEPAKAPAPDSANERRYVWKRSTKRRVHDPA